MAWQRQQDDTAVVEQIALAVDRFHRHRQLPVDRKVADLVGIFLARCFEFVRVADESRLAKERVATAVIGVKVRVHDHVDVFGLQPDRFQVGDEVVARAGKDRHRARHRPPATLGIRLGGRMATRVEQHVAQAVTQQVAGDGQVDGFVLFGASHINAPAHAQAAARQDVHFHFPISLPWSRATRTASTMWVYPVQRHRLPESPSRICASSASGYFWSRSVAVMSMPGVQKPH